MIINVTQEDIDKGLRGNAYKCPIALALKRNGGNGILGVSWAGIWDFNFSNLLTKPTQEVQSFLVDFDLFKSVKPLSFHLSAECFML